MWTAVGRWCLPVNKIGYFGKRSVVGCHNGGRVVPQVRYSRHYLGVGMRRVDWPFIQLQPLMQLSVDVACLGRMFATVNVHIAWPLTTMQIYLF